MEDLYQVFRRLKAKVYGDDRNRAKWKSNELIEKGMYEN